MRIKNLTSGGIITNYSCLSQCAHCLYNSSPFREKDFMTIEMEIKVFRKIKDLGCNYVHIGGGEPFLNPESLYRVLKVAKKEGISVEYVETNASWFRGVDRDYDILKGLKDTGVDTILISISPFHNEYIPLERVRELIIACDHVGIRILPWIIEFYYEIEKLGYGKHSLQDFEKFYGRDYIMKLPERYWIKMLGRAGITFKRYMKSFSVNQILEKSGPCIELLNTTHFHIDLYGNYIPGLCAGIGLDFNDIDYGFYRNKYPLVNILLEEGVRGLYRTATTEYNYKAKNEYLDKCDLCQDIRRFFARNNYFLSELKPVKFYEEIERYEKLMEAK
ncbi:MAG: radical SAM protein [Candidatus Marinimicrobia bacterium]|nr:radical SAM protein [Candidatus Neomarinimicrobiota bacterium]